MAIPWVLLFAIFPQRAAYSQGTAPATSDAQVTFYSNPVTLTGGLTLDHLAAFKGRIFDGEHQLAFLEPHRFVTFRVVPGLHRFTATSWMVEQPDPGAHVMMNIEAGHQYFMECGTNTFGPIFVIREVSCAKASEANSKARPLEAVHLRTDGMRLFIPQNSFPPCE
jgi:hypothetical protein